MIYKCIQQKCTLQNSSKEGTEKKREITAQTTYSGVRHFMLVDLIMWFKNSFSSWITVFTATYIKNYFTNRWVKYNISTRESNSDKKLAQKTKDCKTEIIECYKQKH